MSLIYDSRVGQYRNEKGRFVPRGEVIRLVHNERSRLRTELENLTTSLANNSLSLNQFHQQFATTLKNSHIRMSGLGSGGKANLTPSHYGALGQKLLEEYNYLWNFVGELKAGKITPRQAVYRAGLYSQSTVSAFWKGEHITRKKEGFNQAKRTLDPQAFHCSDCLTYSTNGLWIPIEDIVIPGHRCQCRGNCRCFVSYRKFY